RYATIRRRRLGAYFFLSLRRSFQTHTIDERLSFEYVTKRFSALQGPPGLFTDHQKLPNYRSCILYTFKSTRGIESYANHVERSCDDVGRAQINPVLLRKGIQSQHSVPTVHQSVGRLVVTLAVP